MASKPSDRYAKATRPVNLRTAQPLPEPVAASVHPQVAQRIAMQQARNRLGLPLADLLIQQQRLHTARAGRLPPRPGRNLMVFGAVAIAIGGNGLVFTAVQQLPWAVAAAITGVLVGVVFIWAGRKKARLAGPSFPGKETTPAFTLATPIWDEASIAALDDVVAELALVLPTAAASALSAIKLQLARIQQQTIGLATGTDEHFTIDDRLYLVELVRRYLPDTLQSYLAVPENQRDATISSDRNTATSLLLSQLQMLRQELDKKETKLALSRTENLQRQQRFLQSKASR